MELYKKNAILLNHSYCKIYWEEEIRLMVAILDTPIQVDEEKYKITYVSFWEQILVYKPFLLLVNAQKSRITLNPSDIRFFTNYASQQQSGHLRKIAWVVSEDTFSQLSYELALDRLLKVYQEFKLFGEEQTALEWLKNKDA